MEEQKYYWMLHEWRNVKGDTVQTDHPFIAITQLRKNSRVAALLNWKEISKDDYVLFLDILYNINKYVGENEDEDEYDNPFITITLEKDDRESN